MRQREVVRIDPGLADEQRLAERVALVEPTLEPVPLVARDLDRRRAVVVVLAEVDRGDVVDVLVLGVLRAALAAADRAEADEVVRVDRLDEAGDVGGEVLQDLRRADAARRRRLRTA